MKRLNFMPMGAVVLLLAFFACTNEMAEVQSDELKQIVMTASDFEAENGSRTNFQITGSGAEFSWAANDTVGIFPNEGAQAYFPMTSGAGTKTANFTGGGWALKDASTYAAYYPFIGSFYLDKTAIPVDYTGQVQTGDASTAHLGAYDYMAAAPSTPKNGYVNFAFKHLGALVQLKLTVPQVTTLNSVTLTTENNSFAVKGKVNIMANTLKITTETFNKEVTLDVKNIATTKANQIVTLYMMIPPVDLSSKTLKAVVNTNTGSMEVVLNSKNFQAGMAYALSGTLGNTTEESKEIPYLTFKSENIQTFTMSKAVETLEYSVNNGEWKELGTTKVTFGNSNGNLRVRGKNDCGTATSLESYSQIIFGFTSPVSCSGDIRTLLDYQNYDVVDTEYAGFCHLFENCKNLISAPELPATKLNFDCYSYMFSGCTSLVQTPNLPATVLSDGCYKSMFEGCTSLRLVTELPAMNLASDCYFRMFKNCTSLTQAPVLPATTLFHSCYSEMFSRCTNLTQAPELPAINLADKCYSEMFSHCTSLVQAPELPATSLSASCYLFMFNDCNNLTQVPEVLPATVLAANCYEYMFNDCKRLTKAPELPAKELKGHCYANMFNGCERLSHAPEIPATTVSTGSCAYMFKDCVNLIKAPEILPATALAANCYEYMFSGCTKLTQAPILPAKKLMQYSYYRMFEGCRQLNSITMLAIDTKMNNCLGYWVEGVSSTGTFIKDKSAGFIRGTHGIPNGWIVKNYGE